MHRSPSRVHIRPRIQVASIVLDAIGIRIREKIESGRLSGCDFVVISSCAICNSIPTIIVME